MTFGKNAKGIVALGEGAAKALGLSKTEFNGLAVRFSNFAQTVAGKGGDVVGTMDDLTTRASDFASVMNLDVNQAAELFQSGLAGETEPLRQYGIDLSAAAVSTYAYANGIGEAGTGTHRGPEGPGPLRPAHEVHEQDRRATSRTPPTVSPTASASPTPNGRTRRRRSVRRCCP